MRFDIITIFPNVFGCYFNESIIKRAQKKKLIKIGVHDLRGYTNDKHKTIDDKPYGGGVGMLLKVEPIYKAVEAIKKLKIKNEQVLRRREEKGKTTRENLKPKNRIILFSAKGKTIDQVDVRRLAKYDQLIMICGRYEGVDERVAKYIADEELSVGNYVLTGGEIPAMIVVDAVSRLVPGVLGKKESLMEESFAKNVKCEQVPRKREPISNIQYLEYPQYTRPENFRGWKAPRVLLSGNHEKINEWKRKYSKNKSIK